MSELPVIKARLFVLKTYTWIIVDEEDVLPDKPRGGIERWYAKNRDKVIQELVAFKPEDAIRMAEDNMSDGDVYGLDWQVIFDSGVVDGDTLNPDAKLEELRRG